MALSLVFMPSPPVTGVPEIDILHLITEHVFSEHVHARPWACGWTFRSKQEPSEREFM